MADIKQLFSEVLAWFDDHAALVIPVEIFVCLLIMWRSFRADKLRNDKFLAAFGTDEPLQTWKTDQEWRKPTGIRIFEGWKATLLSHEEFLREGREAALNFQRRRASLRERQAGYLKTTWCESRTKRYDEAPIKAARPLCEALDRIWTGDAHLEVEDRNDKLRVLKRELGECEADKTYSRNRLNDQIIGVERELRDLAEIVRRAQERAKVSPHEAKLRDAREIHEKDVHHDMTKAFLGVVSQMEIFRKRAELKKQVADDPNFTKEEKERLIATIEEAAAAADSTSVPARQSKAGSIYKEERR